MVVAVLATVSAVRSESAAADTIVARVNAGGAVVSGTPTWTADTVATPSSALVTPANHKVSSTGATIDTSDASLPTGTPANLFQSERWDPTGKTELTWALPATVGTDYEVRLYFAETYAPNFTTGARVFDVTLDGATVLDDFDIYAQAGAGNKGIMRSFDVTADGPIDIRFLRGVENPTVSAIEVVELTDEPGAGPAVASVAPTAVAFPSTTVGSTAVQQVTVTNTAVAGSQSLQVSGTTISGAGAASFSDDLNNPVTLAPGQSATVNVTFAPTAPGALGASLQIAHSASGSPLVVALSGTATPAPEPEPGGEVLFRVDSGGAGTAGDPAWTTDTVASPSPYVVTPGNSRVASTGSAINITDPSIPAGTPASIFQNERWDPTGKTELTYAFPVTAGEYQVRLYFAETATTLMQPGARLFDIELEGAVVADDFDQFVAAGAGNKGVVRTFTVQADNDIDLRFLHVVENPAIKAIEILTPGDTQPVPDAVLEAAPTSVSFGQVAQGQTSSTQVALTNTATTGGDDLVVTGLTITGAQAAQFSVAGTLPNTLSPGETTNVTVSYSPTVEGAAAANLQIAHDGTNPTVSVALSGQAPPTSGPSGEVLYRINAGGAQLAGTPVWTADSAASPSPLRNTGSVYTTATNIDITDPSIPAGTPAAMFQTERYDQLGGQEMTWTFPTAPGEYEVRLYFSENYAPLFVNGARQFDVVLEGQTVLDNFDVFAAAGAGNKGIMRSFPVFADTDIDLVFNHVIENPSIKGIEIISGDTAQPIANLGATPSSLAMGNTQVGSAKVLPIQLHNTGSVGAPALQITGTELTGPGAEQFSDSFDEGTPPTLDAGESTTVDVTFSPAAAGATSASLVITHTGENSPLIVPISATGTAASPPGQISFNKSTVQGFLGFGTRPTTVKWGPDGRLYVGRIDGTVSIGTIQRTGPNEYSATNVQNITSITTLPNHDDNGQPNPSITGRMVTGLEVVGTAQNPVIYLVSSDPRIGSPQTGDLHMDTNSGILSRLAWNGSSWVKTDLIRGLPRSKEQHSVQSILYQAETNDLLLFSGGQTNHGAPSGNFMYIPEYALTSAILRVDLDTLPAGTYDIPTLDDEDRPGVNDTNDPFGGNGGKNQARLVPGGPVSIYAAGMRNAYDGVITSTGLYTIDNGGNFGWGGIPASEGPQGNCTNAIDNTGPTLTDSLHRITGPGYYGGHPNPTRGNMANTFNASNPQSPVSVDDPVECDFHTATERDALAWFPTSTNGMDQFTATNFGGAMTGDLVAAAWDNNIYRVDMSADGTQGTPSVLFSNVGAYPLDITTSAPTDPFPGTMWVVDYGTKALYVYEPADFDGGGFECTGADNAAIDEDGDGYDNHDEIVNGTDPCSGGDVPSDFDGDDTSDRLDNDDDNDGINDVSDEFALDAQNGLGTQIPISFPWDSDTPLDYGILKLGLTGAMTNGVDNWQDAYDINNMTVIGAAGVVSVDALPQGDALGAANSQKYAMQFGVDARPTSTGPFEASTSMPNPFGAHAPLAGHSWGMQVGTGTQDDYVKVVVAGANGGEMQLVREVGGVAQVLATSPLAMPGPLKVDAFIWVDPATNTMQASYTSTDANSVTSERVLLGAPFTVPASWFQAGFAVGLIGTSGGAASPANSSWDFVKVLDAPTPPVGGGNDAGQWVDLADMPREYEATSAVELGGYIYVAGGGCQGTGCLGFHQRYDPAADTWSDRTPLPANISHMQAVTVGGLIYYIGGVTEPDDIEVGTNYIYNPTTNSFTLGAPLPAGRERGGSGVSVHNGKIYVSGGIRGTHAGQSTAMFDVYDPATNTWTQLADMPTARDHVHSAVIGNKLYLIGGRHSPSGLSATVNRTDVYDFTTSSWSSLPQSENIPTPRSGAGTVAVGDEIFVFGGELATGVPAAVEAFNVTTNTWRSLTSMTTPRHGFQAVHCAGGIYLAGGSISPQYDPVATNDVLRFSNYSTCPKP
jgi:N-acetylneuraminic acid mutarotase